MKLVLAVFALLFFAPLAPAQAAQPAGVPLHASPRTLPEIAFSDGDGHALSLRSWRGKVVLLNVWATWCGPCREEMPTLDRLQRLLGGERFDVVALSIDRAGPGVVDRFFDDVGIEHLGRYIDRSGKVARDLDILGLPATLLIGPDGVELGRLVGPAEWDTPEMLAFFRTIIAQPRKGT